MDKPDNILVDDAEWNKLDDLQKQFLIQAEAGHFRYQAVDGRVCAWGVYRAGVLFDMEVNEKQTAEDSIYTLKGDAYDE